MHRRTSAPIAAAEGIAFRMLHRTVLPPLSLELHTGECLVITGPNGCGKSLLAEILAGVRSPSSGVIGWPGLAEDPGRRAALVSFESQERLLERERREDMSSIMHGRLDPGHTVLDVLGGRSERAAELATRFGLEAVLARGLRFLSTGEFRKTLLAAAIASAPQLLVLDEPYDGLDSSSRAELSRLIAELHTEQTCLVLVLNRRKEIPAFTDRIVELGGERPVITRAGAPSPGGEASPHERRPPPDGRATLPGRPRRPDAECAAGQPIAVMRGVSVAYGTVPVLNRLDWTVCPEDRWMIVGPNGSGKSTLLSLITGDNPKAFGQDVTLFGRPKGSGESVWEIKRRIGYVSGDLQFSYPLRASVREAVLSGFYDSIGLYDDPTGYQSGIAEEWIERIGLGGRAEAKLRGLSFGLRRMVLVARAMVKRPRLLIADEPCQGLDDDHAEQVLALLEAIAAERTTCLLYVTHDPQEQLRSITHRLELVAGPNGSRGVTTVL